jgi:hypothetical protein
MGGHVARIGWDMRTNFWSENLNGRGYWENLIVDGDKFRLHLRKIGCECVKWIYVTQDCEWSKQDPLLF